jgi:hypothetical protein
MESGLNVYKIHVLGDIMIVYCNLNICSFLLKYKLMYRSLGAISVLFFPIIC